MEWQPIETAPKNRKLILGYTNPNGKWRTVLGCFYEKGHLPLSEDAEGYDDYSDENWAPEAWYEETEAYEELTTLQQPPTHWMPLPKPPAA